MHEVEELVVNWHITEACNFSCRFCYAKWDIAGEGSEIWKSDRESRRLLLALQRMFNPESVTSPFTPKLRWQSLRLSLAGGEPTVLGKRLLNIITDAKSLGFRVSLITNGSRPDVITRAARYIDVLTVSIDSVFEATNAAIGRHSRNGRFTRLDELVSLMREVRSARPDIKVKVNTVVNTMNAAEDFAKPISDIKPNRWKIMRALPIITQDLAITDRLFLQFVERHQQFRSIMTAEDNIDMVESYIMIDPYGRFFQNRAGHVGYQYSRSILDVGADAAFREINFNAEKFVARYPAVDDGKK